MTLAAETRYERKLDVRGRSVAELVSCVRAHPAGWRPLYPERAVHSVYWDTAAFTSFFEHQSGVERRLKTRVRWYGDDPLNAALATLEFKIKIGAVGGKERYAIGDVSALLDAPALGWAPLWTRAGVPGRVRAEMLTRLPAVWISYKRQYWMSADQKFRLTIDRDIAAGVWRKPAFGAFRSAFGFPVLEIKYAVDADTVAPELFQAFPFRPSKNSKYIAAAGRLLGLAHA